MENNLELLGLRVDALTGGAAAMHAMLLALAETHPNPQRLSEVLEVFLQRTIAGHTSSPYGDGLLDAIHSVGDQYREQLRLRLGKPQREPSSPA